MSYKPKYYTGGYFSGTNPNFKTNVGNAANLTNFAGTMLQNIAPESAVGEIGGGALSGAATGAAAGMALGPAGAVVGGALGLVGGAIGGIVSGGKRRAALHQQAVAREQQRVAMQGNYDKEVLSQYNTSGNEVRGYYARGGTLNGLTTETTKPIGKVSAQLLINSGKTVRKLVPSATRPGYGSYVNYDSSGKQITIGPSFELPITQDIQYASPIPMQLQDGSIKNWGEIPVTDPILSADVLKSNPLSDKARGLDNTYNPARWQQQGKSIPTQKRSYTYAKGGLLNSEYEVEKGEVVQGSPTLEEGTQLSSDMHLVGGSKHESGGTEGMGGERVFSDRSKPTKMLYDMADSLNISIPKGTYANVATKLGRMKGKYETKLLTHDPMALRTGKAMLERVEALNEATFQDQEMSKPSQTATTKFAAGGNIYDGLTDETTNPPKRKGFQAWKAAGMPSDYETPYIKPLTRTGIVPAVQASTAVNRNIAANPFGVQATAPVIAPAVAPSVYSPPVGIKSRVARTQTLAPRFAPLQAMQAKPAINIAGSLVNNSIPAPVVPAIAATATPNPQTGILDKVGGLVNEYGADIMNVASFIGNQSAINGMKAPEFNLAPAPRYSYNDRSGLSRYQNQLAVKTAGKGVTNTSAQGRSAEKAAIFADGLNNQNVINNQESMRRDSYNANYDNRVAQNNAMNTDIMNKQSDIQTQVNNEKIGLGIQNRNTLNAGIMSNQNTRSQQELDNQKALTILASTPDPDKALNVLSKFMNPAMAKRLVQLYKRN